MQLTIAHLYPDLMNIYSDMGNIICLVRRCQWRRIGVKVTPISIGQKLDWHQYDLFFGGGGQDRQQSIVTKDLQTKKKALKEAVETGVPMLTTCGTYQLFGHYFKTHEGVKIPGISIFDAYTVASHQRKIGNIIIEINPDFILRAKREVSTFDIISSRYRSNNTLDADSQTKPLGRVLVGFGNNGADRTEGAIYKNCLGTYLHGPVLPKNPHLADWLLKTALERKYRPKINLSPLDDNLEWQAHNKASKRAWETR
jgi:CobQ-like glutamine amidotransferase family enzyme